MKKIIALFLAFAVMTALSVGGQAYADTADADEICASGDHIVETSLETSAEIALTAKDEWIHIETPEDFLKIADDLDGKYILDADINDWWGGVSTVFSPIGTMSEPFTGELDGNGHTVTGTIAYTGQDEVWGLFGCNEGYIHDLTIGYMFCTELYDRYIDAWDNERSYASLDNEEFPAESTRYYGVLCGMNRGTLENIRFEERTSLPEMNLYPNVNDKICIGAVCACNEGTISGISILGSNLYYRTFDKDTKADIGLICGYQTADAVLENVDLETSYIAMDYFGENIMHIAPAVYAGLLIGEAEGNTSVRNIGKITECDVSAPCALLDADLRLGGLIGHVLGDIELSNIAMENVMVQIAVRNDQEGYLPSASSSFGAGVLVGWADGNVTLSDISLKDPFVLVNRDEGGNPQLAFAGGVIGCSGGDLSAKNITVEGSYAAVNANVYQGAACVGGLCGFVNGTAVVGDSFFSLSLSPWFGGSVLYAAAVLGFVHGDAVFTNVQAYGKADEDTGEFMNNSVMAVTGRTYYLAALAGCAEGAVTADGCVINVFYDIMGGGATLHVADATGGIYNTP